MMDNKKLTGFYGIGWMFWAILLVPAVQSIFNSEGYRWAYIATFSFTLSFLLTPIVREIAIRFSVLDQPAERKVHRNATPLLGGMAIYVAFTTALLSNSILTWPVFSIMIGATIIVLVSVIDDMKDLSAKLKLVVQIVAASIVFWSGTRLNIFPDNSNQQLLNVVAQSGNYAMTLLWIIGITNAMNFLDGTDGLATGLGAVISLILGIVAFQTNQTFLGWFAIAMMGSCLGFLPYNFRRKGPAHIFLGDTGSTFIGFTLACLAINGEWADNNPLISICTPILIFGVPIFDMVHTTVARIFTGKVRSFQDWVAYVGKDHIHHRLFRIFQSNKKTVCLVLAITGGLGISAVVLRQANTFNSILIVFQGILAFSLFSAVNFYQEKALIKLDGQRSSVRVQESFSICGEFTHAGEKKSYKAMALDISMKGIKVLFSETYPIGVDSVITMRLGENYSFTFELPEGKVIRLRKVLLEEGEKGYLECGVQFVDSAGFDLSLLIQKLNGSDEKHLSQIIE